MSALAELSRIGYEVFPNDGRVSLKWTGAGKPPERARSLLAAARKEVDALAGPWDAQKAGVVLSAALGRIAERCPVGCDMNAPAMRERIGEVDEAFEAGDGPKFLSLLAALEATAAREVAAWRKERGEHGLARKIRSETLQAFIWVVDDPGMVPQGAAPGEAVFDAREIAFLEAAKARGELPPETLKAIHVAKVTFPGSRVTPPEPAEPTKAVTIRHSRTKQEVVVMSTVLDGWIKDGWEVSGRKTAHDVGAGEAIGGRDMPEHGPKREEGSR